MTLGSHPLCFASTESKTMEELPQTMKALIKKEEKESYVLEDMEVPEPEGDEVSRESWEKERRWRVKQSG